MEPTVMTWWTRLWLCFVYRTVPTLLADRTLSFLLGAKLESEGTLRAADWLSGSLLTVIAERAGISLVSEGVIVGSVTIGLL